MRILFLAPQPFYHERGTPIAVNLVLRTLGNRGEQVDVLTYHLGKDMHYPGVKIHRIPNIPFIKEISPGFSWKKVVCDLVMLFAVFPMVLRGRYDIVHAVEESTFIALVLKAVFGLPYVYDMDSSLSQQMLDRHPGMFRPFMPIFTFLEGLAIRNACAVVPVCEALSEDIDKYQPNKVVVLHDISLLKPAVNPPEENLRALLGIQGPLMMYVGSLEPYQGIDLLLESFALALKKSTPATLVIIGGKGAHIDSYRELARRMGILERVHFLGPKPLARLADYLAQADILVSPRLQGRNTPMKIYSYLDSGKALLVTDLPTHNQVLSGEVALLVDPTPQDFSRGVLQLVGDPGLRQRLGRNGKRLAAERHTYQSFSARLNTLYDWLSADLGEPPHDTPVEFRLPAGEKSQKQSYS